LKTIKPNQALSTSKKQQIEQMFDDIAGKYDFLNRFLSMGIDISWRRKTINSLKEVNPRRILDVATGTADLAIEALRLNPERVTGVDLSAQMLEKGREKLKTKGLQDKISLVKGDSEKLPFSDRSFDAVTVAFGVRNFENLLPGIREMHRVLRPGGKLAVLEFSKPRSFPFKQVYNFYFSYILPMLGRMVSKSSNAYTYLPESVKHFPEGEAFSAYLQQAGFTNIAVKPLTFGICTLYTGIK